MGTKRISSLIQSGTYRKNPFMYHWPFLAIKVGISRYSNFQTMTMDKWATSKSTQLSTKGWVKLLLLLENALKLNFEAL